MSLDQFKQKIANAVKSGRAHAAVMHVTDSAICVSDGVNGTYSVPYSSFGGSFEQFARCKIPEMFSQIRLNYSFHLVMEDLGSEFSVSCEVNEQFEKLMEDYIRQFEGESKNVRIFLVSYTY